MKVHGCGYWQLKGIPCVHALACLNTIRNTKTEDYIDPCSHTDTWKKCYLGVIHPMPSNNLWPHFLKANMLKPPKVRRLPGRPKKNKRKDDAEKQLAPRRIMKTKFACSRHKGLGNNTRTCTNKPVQKKAMAKKKKKRKAKEIYCYS